VVEVEADARRLPDGHKHRDGDGKGEEEVMAVSVVGGASHGVEDAGDVRRRQDDVVG
jgi:hypothetical protein